jgi:hypothetical protein
MYGAHFIQSELAVERSLLCLYVALNPAALCHRLSVFVNSITGDSDTRFIYVEGQTQHTMRRRERRAEVLLCTGTYMDSFLYVLTFGIII